MGDTLDINLFRCIELIDSKFSLLALLGNLLKQWISIFVSELLMLHVFSLSHDKIVLQIIFITLCTNSPYLTLPLFSIRFSRLFESWVY